MANTKPPPRVPWIDSIKKSKKLRLYLDSSLGQTGWTSVFRAAIVEFNKLSTSLKLGVHYEESKSEDKSEVVARSSRGDIMFSVPKYGVHKTRIPFDGKGVHGRCKPLMSMSEDRHEAERFKLFLAYIYVPAKPEGVRNGRKDTVGDPVKLCIAVHELIHACGIVDDNQHSTDDVFSWPSIKMGTRSADDRLTTKGEMHHFKGLPGEKEPRVGFRRLEMPPIVLKHPTAEKIRKLWR